MNVTTGLKRPVNLEPRSRDGGRVAALAAIVSLPIVVATVRAVRHGWMAVGDNGNFLIRSRGNLLRDSSLCRRRRLLRKSRGVGFASFHIPEHCADWVRLLQLHGDPVDLAFAWCSYAHDRFVRLDIEDFLIVYNFVAGFDLDIDNGGFGDGFAKLRHNDRHLRHSHSERSRGCNAADEVREARLSIPLCKLKGNFAGSFDFASLKMTA